MIVLALGKKGSGKTALIRKLAYLRLRSGLTPLILYHDPGAQIDHRRGALFTSVEDAEAYWRANKALPGLSVFRDVDVDELCLLAMQIKDVTLVIDELDRVCKGKHWESPAAKRIVHEGRHKRVDLFGTFRSTRNVNEDIIGQSDYIFLFRHGGGAYYDLQTVDLRLGPQWAQIARSLAPKHFAVWSDD